MGGVRTEGALEKLNDEEQDETEVKDSWLRSIGGRGQENYEEWHAFKSAPVFENYSKRF